MKDHKWQKNRESLILISSMLRPYMIYQCFYKKKYMILGSLAPVIPRTNTLGDVVVAVPTHHDSAMERSFKMFRDWRLK